MNTKPEETIPPIVKTLTIAHDRATTFRLFTADIHKWWPLSTHCVSTEVCSAPAASCTFEPRVGGHLFEIMANGERRDWGRILTWQPDAHIAFTWHPGRDVTQATHVEIRFEDRADGGTRLTLTHSEWHVLGENATSEREGYHSGWDGVLQDGFVAFLEPTNA